MIALIKLSALSNAEQIMLGIAIAVVPMALAVVIGQEWDNFKNRKRKK